MDRIRTRRRLLYLIPVRERNMAVHYFPLLPKDDPILKHGCKRTILEDEDPRSSSRAECAYEIWESGLVEFSTCWHGTAADSAVGPISDLELMCQFLTAEIVELRSTDSYFSTIPNATRYALRSAVDPLVPAGFKFTRLGQVLRLVQAEPLDEAHVLCPCSHLQTGCHTVPLGPGQAPVCPVCKQEAGMCLAF